jgi:hypothetical protein
MNREDIIRMAREAGIEHLEHMEEMRSPMSDGVWLEDLEHFAALVAEAEREACAKVCEAGVDYEHPTVKGHIMENFGHSRLLAKAIRSRVQA